MRLALAAILFGWIFWRQPSSGRVDWPRQMPAFAGARAACAYEGERSDFASFVSPLPPPAVLAAARSAYLADGWALAPVGTRDMLLFTRDGRVAAVLATAGGGGSVVTVVQRRPSPASP